MRIDEILERNSRIYPNDLAFIELIPSKNIRKTVTWKELDERSNKVANALIDFDVKKGDRVLPKKAPYLNEQQYKENKLIREDPHEIMDNNDELSFMVTDIGDKAAPSDWPGDWLYADELTIKDPLTGAQAWVYLYSFADPPEPSPVNYVKYQLSDGQEDKIHTDIYTIGFSLKNPILQNYLDFNDGDNVVDQSKFRFYYSFFNNLIELDFTENRMESILWQYKEGPIRVIRLVRSSFRILNKISSPPITSETFCYRNAFAAPYRFKKIPVPKGIIDESFVNSMSDYRGCHGWKVRLNTDERWLTVDGEMDEIEKNIKTDNARWYIFKNSKKAFIGSLNFAEDYGLKTNFFYLDDNINAFPPESSPGQIPCIGYHMSGFEDVEYSTVQFKGTSFYFNEETSEQELLLTIDIIDNPLKISSQGFNNSAQMLDNKKQYTYD